MVKTSYKIQSGDKDTLWLYTALCRNWLCRLGFESARLCRLATPDLPGNGQVAKAYAASSVPYVWSLV